MKTYHERRFEKLAERLKARTKSDGSPRPGFEQNVTQLRAEMEQLSEYKGMADNGE